MANRASENREHEVRESVELLEDDNPEAIQDQAAQLAIPDLLNVQSNAGSSAPEDDRPEMDRTFPLASQRMSNFYPPRLVHPSQLSNSLSSQPANSIPSTGAIPKSNRHHVGLPPDVAGQSSSASPSCNISSGALVNSDLVNSSVSLESSRGRYSETERRVAQIENEVITLRGGQSLLSQQLNDSQQVIAQIDPTVAVATNQNLHNLMTAVINLQTSMDAMSRDINERLRRLESRLNTVTANQSNPVAIDGASVMREQLQDIQLQQRHAIQQERSDLMMVLSDALRTASLQPSCQPKSQNDNHSNGSID
ncbi:hypothetical protein HDE_00745 [Halotydeus destructor]|nr:hypothetical protein HDE_00745 [Halotydeus destructor]